MAKITVVAAVVDRGILSLYQPDGTTYVIQQGDARLKGIAEYCLEYQDTITQGLEVDIGGDEPALNAYRAYEEKSNGLVQLFRVAKSVFSGWLNTKPSAPQNMVVGNIPRAIPVSTIAETPIANMVVERTDVSAENHARQKLMGVTPMLPEQSELANAVQQILAQATPVAHESFHDLNVGEKGDQSETIIAVVDGQVIGGMENLKAQMAHASQSNAVGFNKFMERIAKVAAQRSHSVDDLLKFMQRGDLPIADDGSIVIYKALMRDGDGQFVDRHSMRVKQKIGSYVHMDESLVDHDRRNECSNGLHVARRGYLRSFGCDTCVIAKVAPEDVIAVPQYDANKMRVCGYHILFELSNEAYQLLLNDQPLTSCENDAKLLGRALSGDHDAPMEDVKITGQNGNGLVITPREKPAAIQLAEKVTAIVEQGLKEERVGVVLNTEDDAAPTLSAPHVDAVALAQKVTQVKTLSRADNAKKLHDLFVAAKGAKARKEAANNLLLFKQASKVSWTKLGLDEKVGETLKNAVAAG
jgi:hypothetical protein